MAASRAVKRQRQATLAAKRARKSRAREEHKTRMAEKRAELEKICAGKNMTGHDVEALREWVARQEKRGGRPLKVWG